MRHTRLTFNVPMSQDGVLELGVVVRAAAQKPPQPQPRYVMK